MGVLCLCSDDEHVLKHLLLTYELICLVNSVNDRDYFLLNSIRF